ncbi:MAG: hypothetical protein ABIH52_00405 [Candidatus Aenigmatarchaeota archaeon]
MFGKNYHVREVGDTMVDSNWLGYANYDTNEITIPTFASAYMKARESGDGYLAATAKALQDYITRHETEVELGGMKFSDAEGDARIDEEAFLESELLARLEKDAIGGGGFFSWAKFIGAMELHNMKLEDGNALSKGVEKYFKVRDRLKHYGEKMGDFSEMTKRYVKEIFDPEYSNGYELAYASSYDKGDG